MKEKKGDLKDFKFFFLGGGGGIVGHVQNNEV